MAHVAETPSTAIERALSMLELVAQRNGGMSNADLSRKLQIPKSSASYILRALEQRGYLHRDPEGKYKLGLKIVSLSRGALSGIDVREAAAPILRHLMERSQSSVHLATMDHGEAVYIDKVEAPGFIKMDTWVGRRMEVHTTSVGKALVSFLPEDEVEKIVKSRGMGKRTVHTITTWPRLVKEMEKVREQGYAIDDEENNLGVRCVAAPIFDGTGHVIASVGLTGTINRIDKANVPKYAEMVKEAARAVSHQLGYHRRS